ncbi:redoxin family protein [Cupriavidus sp. KK10]|uniref:redoxin family protein n=1 Tax=Cupriavidus sp. KK10 TaxID=1478019 RepID=UPI00201395E0|nr:redoxin family protein [Cupriavidus sp. KK10]
MCWFPISTIRFSAESSTGLYSAPQIPRLYTSFDFSSLVDFWTYTCINCINTLLHVRQWYDKYRHKGLVVVGVHTPEFPFEKSTDNVKAAIKRLDVRYPVAQDNSYATWNNFGNQYWPAVYLIDASGNVVYKHFGEGNYEETEAEIQKLLAARK